MARKVPVEVKKGILVMRLGLLENKAQMCLARLDTTGFTAAKHAQEEVIKELKKLCS